MIPNLLDQWLALLPRAAQNPSDDSGATERTPGQPAFIAGTYRCADGELPYKLFVPAAYAGEPMPLLVMLHGWGQTADDFADGTGMNVLAEPLGCFVLYPEKAGFGYAGCWNWFDKAHQRRDRGDPALIAGATRAVMQSWAINPGRVFIAGMSAGGAMAVTMGHTYPDLFAAVGCHSGLPHACASDPASALQVMRDGATMAVEACKVAGRADGVLPVIVFHGDDDATVNQANGAFVVQASLAAAGLDRHGGEEQPGRREPAAARGRAYSRAIHRRADGAVVAEHWIIHGAGHAWSGGNGRASYTDPQGPPASAEMLRFFLQR